MILLKVTRMRFALTFSFGIFWYCLALLPAFGQEVKIELGEKEIPLNGTFTIKVTISNEKIKSYDKFPEIPGFQQQGVSQSSSMSIVNGQMTSTNSIIQYYKPTRQGNYRLPNFSINVNGQEVKSPGMDITVTEAQAQGGQRRGYDPFDDLFGGGGRQPRQEIEYIEIEDDAFFATSVDKNNVFVGEPVNISLAFYMSEQNQAPFQFYEPGRQLEEILKKLKPTNAWEENFSITNIQPEFVDLDGKRWIKYKVYEATFYPFSPGELKIPSVPWEMIKYRVARNPSFFGSNRLEDFKTFYSGAKVIDVKPLPPHPLKNEVSVGDYRLFEDGPKGEVQTGEGFSYNFRIGGEGNITTIQTPRKKRNQRLSAFDPNVRQQINRGGGRVSGFKNFEYFITSNEPGEVNLANHFEFIYFNWKQARYDTLRPQTIVQVVGESKVNESISNKRLGGIYDLIEVESNKLSNERLKSYFSIFINVLLGLAILVLLYVLIKKRNG
ncbi:hypothetical protein A3SI_07909 [Nitritalea halalkaliphila LW7]|uniref:Protein BatD n=1 Tax=Nitritalea halalkaliphila LW7 TaxID=1189621 RepID=I5C5U0_9BACT|nr:BatD family protein [Nitritalea halalkaliphila]EIM77192.1 hypothetical protein A3SI_07909 [Nitritalea halalkaliphila LW7]